MILLLNFLLLSEDCKNAAPSNKPFSSVNCGSNNPYPNNPKESFADTLKQYVDNEIPRYFKIGPAQLTKEVEFNSPEIPAKSCHFACDQTTKICQTPIGIPMEDLCLNSKAVQDITFLISFENWRNKQSSIPLFSKKMIADFQDFQDFQKDPRVFEQLIDNCATYYKNNFMLVNAIALDALFTNVDFCLYARMPGSSTSITAKFIQEKQKTCPDEPPIIKPLPETTISPNKTSSVQTIPSVTPSSALENQSQKTPTQTEVSTSVSNPNQVTSPSIEGSVADSNAANNSTTIPSSSPTISQATSPTNSPTMSQTTSQTTSPIPSQSTSQTISLTVLLDLLRTLMPGANTPTPYAPSPQPYMPYYPQYGMPYSAPMGLPAVVNNPLFMQGFPGYGYPLVPGFFQPSASTSNPSETSTPSATSTSSPEISNSSSGTASPSSPIGNLLNIMLNTFSRNK